MEAIFDLCNQLLKEADQHLVIDQLTMGWHDQHLFIDYFTVGWYVMVQTSRLIPAGHRFH